MLAFVAITGLHPDLTKVEVHTYYKKFDLPSSWVHFAVFNLLRILLHIDAHTSLFIIYPLSI